MGVKPLKRFGQNYLKDKNTIEKISRVFAPRQDDSVIEIGPGLGALTSEIHDKVKNYAAIEIDNRVIESLKEKFPAAAILNADFLKTDFDIIPFPPKYRVIGNIPYNITAPILFRLIEYNALFLDALLMVQYEVAARLTAKPKTKQYGLLTVILNYFAEVKLEFKISPNVFYPKPKVSSAIISLKFKEPEIKADDEKQFIALVKSAFATRRKTIRNSLKNSIFESYINLDLPVNISKRAEDLTVNAFVNLSNFISRKNAGR